MPASSAIKASSKIIAALTTLCLLTPAAAEPENVSALLLAKTQAFSDAGQRGNASILKTLLDDKVVFFNENGEASTKDDIVSSATPSPGNSDVKMVVTDWHCELHGDVAVASFIDDQTRDLHGQIFHAQYRSVETWLREDGSWLMIGSQTIALQSDPASVVLPLAALDQYAGTYQATPELKAVFTRDRGGLYLSANGSPPIPQLAELRDVFFTAGSPRVKRIFQRDEHGNVVGFISCREGHDIFFKRIAPS